ncbi:hypothetical protein [Microcoleus sp. herbarium5]|uniref:hypothetical protein n=1 Tax=Microcoleus sp. herbarium5 TaxID=3055434 RepID=UPI002FD45BA2
MSQELNFYKQNILDEDEAQKLEPKEVFEKVKILLEKYDIEDANQDLRELFFKEVEIFSIDISAYNQEIDELLSSEVQFFSKQSGRFMMTKKFWVVFEKIILDHCKIISAEKNSKSKKDIECGQKLDELYTILKDFSTLKELFKRNSLFVNIF